MTSPTVAKKSVTRKSVTNKAVTKRPVSKSGTVDPETLAWAEHSALFWSTHLGSYSRRMRSRVDAYVLAAAIISAVTGAAVWTTVANTPGVWAQALVMAIAVTSTIVALVPKQLGYSDAADKSADLSVNYTKALYALRSAAADVAAHRAGAAKQAMQALDFFESVRADKEHLRPYPKNLQDQLQAERDNLHAKRVGLRVDLVAKS